MSMPTIARKKKQREPETGVREKLLACATTLFTHKGYTATTVREIVAAAGVTKPVLYYYFGNKEGLYIEIMRHLLTDFEQRLEHCRGFQGTATERVLHLCDEMFSLFLEHTDYIRLIYSVYYGPQKGVPFFDFDVFHAKLVAGIRDAVQQGIQSGEFRQANSEAMTMAVLGALTVAAQARLSHPELPLGNDGLARILDAVLTGISSDRAKTKGQPQR